MNLNEALDFVVFYGNPYASAYAQAAREIVGGQIESGLRIQLMYVLSNFSGCRAAGAKEARACLKSELANAS